MKRTAKIITALSVFFLSPEWTVAQNVAAETAKEDLVFSNPLFLTLLGVVIVLALLIGVLGGAVVNLLKYKFNLGRKGQNTASLLLTTFLLGSENAQAATDIAGIHSSAFWLIISVIIIELFIISWFVLIIYRIFGKEKEAIPAPVAKTKEVSWFSKFWTNLNDSVEIEKEADVLLEHDYDGIKELDNNLPPWWKYGFYCTIVFAVIYLLWFHAGNGLSSAEELERSIAKAKAEIEAYKATQADMVDETTVVFLSGEADLLSGRELFINKCRVCHGEQGQGSSMAPNLTDEYWLHGGSINDIFATIKYGVAGKGMQSWRNEFSPKEIAQISSFIKSLQGSNPPDAWQPQGERYVEEGSEEEEEEREEEN